MRVTHPAEPYRPRPKVHFGDEVQTHVDREQLKQKRKEEVFRARVEARGNKECVS